MMDFSTLEKVADEVGTPFFVYHPGRATEIVQALRREAEAWGDFRIAYSVKTNPLSELLRELHSAGTWAEVVSDMELRHAESVGFSRSQVVLNGPLKAAGVGPEVFDLGGINIDGLEELDILAKLTRDCRRHLRLGIRVCTPMTSPTWSRFGLNVENGEFSEAVDRIRREEYLTLSGLHVHLGTQVEDSRSYSTTVRLLKSLWSESGLSDDGWLDIGGGYPFDHSGTYAGGSSLPDGFFQALAAEWGSPRPQLWMEPGRIVAGPTMTLVTRVLARKRRPREPDILIVDSGTNHNVMGAFYEHDWSFSRFVSNSTQSFRICGPLCMEDDIMSGERHGPLPAVGSLALMANSGAYSLALSRKFIQLLPPVINVVSDQDWMSIDTGSLGHDRR